MHSAQPHRLFYQTLIPVSLAALAGLAQAASIARLTFEATADGVTWSQSLRYNALEQSSHRILVRSLFSWVSTGAEQTPAGLASLTFQPVLGVARPIDGIAPFIAQGNNLNGGGITLDGSALDGPFGRSIPFAATGPSGIHAYSAHRHDNGWAGAPLGDYLRIARNDVWRWMGSGDTTGTTAVNNFNGSGGLAIVQKGARVRSPSDPAFSSQLTDINAFQFAIDLGPLGIQTDFSITVSAPQEGISRDSVTGQRITRWFSSTDDDFGSIKTEVMVLNATIDVIPAPGVFALLSATTLLPQCRHRQLPHQQITSRK